MNEYLLLTDHRVYSENARKKHPNSTLFSGRFFFKFFWVSSNIWTLTFTNKLTSEELTGIDNTVF